MVTSDDGARGINPRQHVTLSDLSDQLLGLQLPQMLHLMLPWKLVSEEEILVVLVGGVCVCVGGGI